MIGPVAVGKSTGDTKGEEFTTSVVETTKWAVLVLDTRLKDG